jgi:hypothetical protein
MYAPAVLQQIRPRISDRSELVPERSEYLPDGNRRNCATYEDQNSALT